MTIKSVEKIDPDKAKSLGRVGLKMFFKLADIWGLNEDEQLVLLGLPSRATLAKWKSQAEANQDIMLEAETIERLSLIVGIQKSVELLFPEGHRVVYMRAPNKSLDGESILDVMLAGDVSALYKARRYLDASRQTHYL